MAGRITVGEKLPFFLYDTPYSAQNRLRDLLAAKSPLVLLFMANFGHPITRTFANRYAETFGALRDGALALVVRSRADKLARSIGPDTLPYPLMCDADGVLYDYLDIPQSASPLMTYSLEAWRILRDAKKQGFRAAKGASYQLPLTLILDRDGTVLFCHYGASLTDVPEDCASIQSLLEELDLTPDVPELAREALRQAFAETAPRARRAAVLWAGLCLAYALGCSAVNPHPQQAGAAVLDRDPSGEFLPPEVIREYGAPDLAETSVIDLFDDPYEDD